MLGEYKLNEIYNKDSLEFLKKRADYEFDINYSDPPYALGSEVIIKPNGKVDYKKANDFMNKWEMPTGEYWEQWFKEAYRTLKHGGYCIMFGMDRQLLLFKYYANLAGFEEQQSLYWYFISNFPKATDLSKQIDKNNGRNYEDSFRIYIDNKRKEKSISLKAINELFDLSTNGGGVASYIFSERQNNGLPTKKQYQLLKNVLDLDDRYDELIDRVEAERKVIGKSNYTIPQIVYDVANGSGKRLEQNITAPSTDLAKKYEGYKYSISPLKQTNETILIFRKPYKSGSCLRDVLLYEKDKKLKSDIRFEIERLTGEKVVFENEF